MYWSHQKCLALNFYAQMAKISLLRTHAFFSFFFFEPALFISACISELTLVKHFWAYTYIFERTLFPSTRFLIWKLRLFPWKFKHQDFLKTEVFCHLQTLYDKGLNMDLFSSLTLENSVSIRFQVCGISLLHTDYVISFLTLQFSLIFKTLTDCLHTNTVSLTN